MWYHDRELARSLRHQTIPPALWLVFACYLALFFGSTESWAKTKIQRIALLVGHNQAQGIKSLKFAQNDVTRVAKVLKELGGYKPQNIHLMKGPTLADVRRKMKEIQSSYQKDNTSRIFFFYFSGHSTSSAFLLGNEQLDHQELLKYARALPVTLRFVIVDSCYSGRLTQFKGTCESALDCARGQGCIKGKCQFQVNPKGMTRKRKHIRWIPRHFKVQFQGEVILTSSGALSRSFESSDLKSSFFTASLLSGLRGAADQSNDQIVTLAEIRKYVYLQTVQYSYKYKVKVQRPQYLINIKGRGELPVTYLKRAEGQVEFSGNVRGDVLLYQGSSMIEYKKSRGKTLRVGLRAGKYRLYVQDKGWFAEKNIVVKNSSVKKVSQVNWKQLSITKQAKGRDYTHTVRFGILGHYAPISQLAIHGAGLSLSVDAKRWIRISMRYQFAASNLNNIPYQAHEFGFPVAFGYGIGFSAFALWLGAYVEPRVSVRANIGAPDTFLNLGIVLGGTTSFDIHFTTDVVLRLKVSGGAQIIFFDAIAKTSPALDVGLGVAWRL